MRIRILISTTVVRIRILIGTTVVRIATVLKSLTRSEKKPFLSESKFNLYLTCFHKKCVSFLSKNDLFLVWSFLPSACVNIYALRLGSYYFNPTEYRGMTIAHPVCAGYKNRMLIYTYAQCDYANHDLALSWYM